MIDPTLRLERIAAEAADPTCGVLLLDLVLGSRRPPAPGRTSWPRRSAPRVATRRRRRARPAGRRLAHRDRRRPAGPQPRCATPCSPPGPSVSSPTPRPPAHALSPARPPTSASGGHCHDAVHATPLHGLLCPRAVRRHRRASASSPTPCGPRPSRSPRSTGSRRWRGTEADLARVLADPRRERGQRPGAARLTRGRRRPRRRPARLRGARARARHVPARRPADRRGTAPRAR